MDYIHYNPVKHDYVETPGAWPHSSFRQAMKDGLYDPGSLKTMGMRTSDWMRNLALQTWTPRTRSTDSTETISEPSNGIDTLH